ncbi:diacylglycerol/polyprenol kinase family protein [Candidatus Xianfuyuplasma coldseepsis]|uniref:Dolichol kinase n=1 Tax=Candidatus Xianfuyuplasma coldseepsis TaxID=2782163 RepID=A0A7L7KRM4_9MOLU|nr:hypothetical protein [Xianfuyuplasma coldseepsis]QMS85480.1 hypothetical protein G4Z02_06905 [Xianfuyuplasma coldseepsis]
MALLYSYGFVFAVIGVSALLGKVGLLSDEGSRKFIHIGVGNWIILAYMLFDNLLIALIGPASFIVLNYLSYRYHWIAAMERQDDTRNSLGTVYYAISLFVVVFLDYLIEGAWAYSLLPILVMAYGDGLSAIVGLKFSSKQLINHKSVYGTMTMFVVTLIIGFILLSTVWMVVIVAVVATLVELFSPRGYDNLSVPLVLYIVMLLL